MQLDKLVNYYKALSDRNRIRILILLAKEEMNGLTLAEKLGVTPATITHHIAKLKAVGIVMERREKNASIYRVSQYLLEQNDGALVNLMKEQQNMSDNDNEQHRDKHEKMRESVLKSFFTPDQTLKQIPSQLKKKLIALEFMVQNLEIGKKYSEKEINEYIQTFHPDYATLRREFIMHQYMFRENEVYELNPREMWAKWQNL
ncbi:metalloregulator ArsR/SmtB family transcription factor [Cohnella pontilimi]|uniref:Metalloregulator ArsR/SmtB family transcription factor n=1 Tax=Cohnella pontilimi TaxID=2564100 RepID=A0A4U0F950_9BACL|nr:metalloregulator ArsR/SmtB family transcription factor [Cohnella pontilimi]TJY41283.1 metalloregulator ArsR/SmtB family transcription factor [Cohnella pontilimi]